MFAVGGTKGEVKGIVFQPATLTKDAVWATRLTGEPVKLSE